MTSSHRIGQHFIVGFVGRRITPTIKKLIRRYHVGGVILFSRNIRSVGQLKGLVGRLKALSKTPLLVGVDQEGGSVRRLKSPFTRIPPMADIGRYYSRARRVQLIRGVGQILGRELKAVGINWDFAPVVDVHSNPKNPVIGNRSFGPDPAIVFHSASAVIQGLHSEGILSCAKHFPGHGSTSQDSHLTLPVVRASRRLLWKRDLYPYRRLISSGVLKTVMMAHVCYPELDPENCATLSHRILTGILRRRLKFSGLIVSDDLRMKAVQRCCASLPEACRRFFLAGGDMAMICEDSKGQMEAIDSIARCVKGDAALKRRLKRSGQRIQRVCAWLETNPHAYRLDSVGCPAHQRVVGAFAPFSK